jgi:hypothetical protein
MLVTGPIVGLENSQNRILLFGPALGLISIGAFFPQSIFLTYSSLTLSCIEGAAIAISMVASDAQISLMMTGDAVALARTEMDSVLLSRTTCDRVTVQDQMSIDNAEVLKWQMK